MLYNLFGLPGDPSPLTGFSETEFEQAGLLSLSISVLIVTLVNALWTIEKPERQRRITAHIPFPTRELLRARLHTNRWCPAQVNNLVGQTDAVGLYIASCMTRRPLPHENYISCERKTCLGNPRVPSPQHSNSTPPNP